MGRVIGSWFEESDGVLNFADISCLFYLLLLEEHSIMWQVDFDRSSSTPYPRKKWNLGPCNPTSLPPQKKQNTETPPSLLLISMPETAAFFFAARPVRRSDQKPFNPKDPKMKGTNILLGTIGIHWMILDVFSCELTWIFSFKELLNHQNLWESISHDFVGNFKFRPHLAKQKWSGVSVGKILRVEFGVSPW